MAVRTFDELLEDDVHNVFLKEFSVEAIYKSSDNNIQKIVVQFFEESLDKLSTQYYHAWCSLSSIPYVKKNETLQIKGIVYGIVDFTPDEFGTGVNLFLSEV